MEKDEKIKSSTNEVKNRIVETYAEDMAKVIGDDTKGLVKKIIHGEEKHQEEKKNLSPESKKNKLFMFIGVLLIILGLTTFSFLLFFRKNNNVVPVTQQLTPLIFNDKSVFVEILGFDSKEIAQTVLNQINATNVKSGGIEGIYLTENQQIIGLRKFLSLIESKFAPDPNPLLISDNFLMGVVNEGTSLNSTNREGFFILLKVRSAADIFGALRAWEGKMFSDLHEFMGIDISEDTDYLLTKSFEDGIVDNKNARLLYDNNGNLVLTYIFADDNSVIITDFQDAAREIILRLSSAQKAQ